MNLNSIILGSGNLYVAEYDADTGIPADETIETTANTMGRIKGGATLEYKPTTYEVVDDTQYVVKRFVQSEEVTFKSGVLTWDMANLQRLAGACEYTNANGKQTIKVGGRGANGLKPYVIRFVHNDGEKVLRVSLVGTSNAGFSLAFVPDKETVIDAEFKALSSDEAGTLVIVTESVIAQ